MTGISQKSETKYLSRAAPVGVQSSELILPEYTGISFKIYAVAGAGTGSMPWAQ